MFLSLQAEASGGAWLQYPCQWLHEVKIQRLCLDWQSQKLVLPLLSADVFPNEQEEV